MKIYITIFILFFAFVSGFTQTANPNFDTALAGKLGADAYGMKSYVLVMLKTGSNTTTEKAYIDSCFSGHMANINRLANEGKLVVSGPMGKNEKNYRGIFILNIPLEDATGVLQTDPAIHSGLLACEIYPWYGSAALPLYLEAADKIWQEKP
jgi:uncharacterized protein